MNQSTRKTILMTLLAFCMLVGTPAIAGASDYYSIQEIYQNTPERWTETYETTWRTISVDCPIEVPDVQAFPVIRVRLMPAVPTDQLSDYHGELKNMDGFLQADRSVDMPWFVGAIPKNRYVYRKGETPDRQPENVDLTYEEALAFCETEISRFWGLSMLDFDLEQVVVEDRLYYCTRQGPELIFGKPANDQGKYKFRLKQLMHGIQVEGGKQCYDGGSLSNETYLLSPFCAFTLKDIEHARIRSALYQEVDVVYEDIPLLSFADAKAAVETEIYAGHLRTVSEVKLCYIPYLDAKDSQIRWLLPAWYVRGFYTRDVKQELEIMTEGDYYEENMNQMEVIFEAQRGKLLDYNDHRKNRRVVPACVTWSQVK